MRARRAAAFAITVVLAALAALAASAQPLAPRLPTMQVTIGGERFTLEVARDPATQFRGLGGRTRIDPHGGMLFVFPSPRATAFAMRLPDPDRRRIPRRRRP
jgi:hypothetical protein